MTITLPYSFDTSLAGKTVFKVMVGVQFLIAVASLKFLFITPHFLELVGVLIITALVTKFGLLIFKKMNGASGTVSRNGVNIKPTVMFGMKSDSPEGHFPLSRFRGIKVEYGFFTGLKNGPIASPHERVYLLGKEGTPDIRIAFTQNKAGFMLAKELSELLELPVEDKPSY